MKALAPLPPEAQFAFALACALRLRPYFQFGGSPALDTAFREALQALVRHAETDGSLEELTAIVGQFEVVCDVDDDAVAATIYSFRALGPNGAESAAWAAETAYNARDRAVVQRLQVDFRSPGAEQTVLHDPEIQNEFRRQRVDLDALLRNPDERNLVISRALAHGSRENP